jgi:hypothetical protein
LVGATASLKHLLMRSHGVTIPEINMAGDDGEHAGPQPTTGIDGLPFAEQYFAALAGHPSLATVDMLLVHSMVQTRLGPDERSWECHNAFDAGQDLPALQRTALVWDTFCQRAQACAGPNVRVVLQPSLGDRNAPTYVEARQRYFFGADSQMVAPRPTVMSQQDVGSFQPPQHHRDRGDGRDGRFGDGKGLVDWERESPWAWTDDADGRLEIGGRVFINGLRRSPYLNGRRGTLVLSTILPSAGRHAVLVDGEPGPPKSILAKNLKVMVAPGEASWAPRKRYAYWCPSCKGK